MIIFHVLNDEKKEIHIYNHFIFMYTDKHNAPIPKRNLYLQNQTNLMFFLKVASVANALSCQYLFHKFYIICFDKN